MFLMHACVRYFCIPWLSSHTLVCVVIDIDAHICWLMWFFLYLEHNSWFMAMYDWLCWLLWLWILGTFVLISLSSPSPIVQILLEEIKTVTPITNFKVLVLIGAKVSLKKSQIAKETLRFQLEAPLRVWWLKKRKDSRNQLLARAGGLSTLLTS